MNITEWYARNFGISEIDIAETPWLLNWIKLHHNNLKYNYNTFKFQWID